MDVLPDGWSWWAVSLAGGAPVVLVVLTEAIGAATRRGAPIAGPLRLLRNWVIPAGALLALCAVAYRSPSDQSWVRVVATVFGFLLILLLLSSFNLVLFSQARPGTWRERTPTIFVEIVRMLLVAIGLALLFKWVWGTDIGGLVAALGVTSIVLGLALQNAVGGVISGLLLLFEQPFQIGEWLDTGSVSGRVIEVNWRAVHIDTGSGIQIVPNSTLSGASFTNMSQPPGPYLAAAPVRFGTDDPPQEVLALLIGLADALPMRVAGVRASAGYRGAGTYEVAIPLTSPADAGDALTLYHAWLWYAARRHGLALDGDASDPIAEPERLSAALDEVAPTLRLDADDRELVLGTSRLERYAAGEPVLPAGVVPDEVRFVLTGSARLTVDVDGGAVVVGVTEAGDFIGHTALTRERTQVTTVAADVLTVLTIPLVAIDDLIRRRPQLAADIGQSLELKRQSAAAALMTIGGDRSVR